MRNKQRPGQSAGLPPRRAALALLQAVLADGRLLSEAGPVTQSLPGPDRARAERLAATVLRHLARADAVLAPHLAKAPPRKAMNVLRLAAIELCHEGVPAHAAVDAAVNLMRADRKTRHMAGLANAVLRKVAAEGPEIWADLPPNRLPDWLRQPLIAAWGGAAIRAIEAAHTAGAPLDLTLKHASDAARLAGELGALALPTGSLRLTTPGQVSALPGYAEGDWWVQDAAAALPVRCLGDLAGKAVLDLCAAPGGKTMQLAAAGAEVTALDVSDARMARVRENLERTGLSADLVVADALDWQTGRRFDAVLLDAPCSATGTIRRHPDLPHVKTAAGIAPLLDMQAAMLDRAQALLAPGGTLVYCTCSLLPEEGEAQVERLLSRHPGLCPEPIEPAALGLGAAQAAPGGALRLRPDHWADLGGMDGFYIACLRAA